MTSDDARAERLAAKLADAITERLLAALTGAVPPSPYLNYKQAAAYLGCSDKTLRNARSRGLIRP